MASVIHVQKNILVENWDFNKQDWDYSYVDSKVALKETKDSRHDISKLLKEVKNLIIANGLYFIIKCIGISKNPSNQNYIIVMKLYDDKQFKIAAENQEKAIKSQKHESSLLSSISHPQSCYISRNIHTLHGLHNSLEDIKSGKFQEQQECIDWEKEIQNRAKKKTHSLISQL
ncbi:2986_t:CDS:2 [Diversispora eburnea]|uniref:2986_t:CDS:1 n=1 Tax=Diversispora eburnea TaxID=1213867 RepID=A0A9N8ZZY0_9GLOM|nr:2986_t:CDS:2 [Diversispora eburnea]